MANRAEKEALANALLVFAILMQKLQDLGDRPTPEEKKLIGSVIEQIGDIIKPPVRQ